MNDKENESNNLGGFLRPDGSKRSKVERGDLLPAEILKKLNELMEQLHGLRNLTIKKLENEKIIKLENSEELDNSKIEKSKDEKNENEKSVQIIIYEKGSQHIEKQINIGVAHPDPSLTPDPGLTPDPSPKGEGNYKGEGNCKGRVKGMGESGLPGLLSTEKAMTLWEKAQEAGFVDEDYLPLLSHTQSALLANAMATRLGIREKWKVFETLWNRTKMYKDYYQALEQKQSLAFQDKLKQLFA